MDLWAKLGFIFAVPRKDVNEQRIGIVSEFEDLLCALCVPQRSLRLN